VVEEGRFGISVSR